MEEKLYQIRKEYPEAVNEAFKEYCRKLASSTSLRNEKLKGELRMPTKTSEVEVKVEAPDADVHHMIRRVGQQARPDGTRGVDEVDNDVRVWLQAGYRLAFVQSLGLEPGGVNILYIFVKE